MPALIRRSAVAGSTAQGAFPHRRERFAHAGATSQPKSFRSFEVALRGRVLEERLLSVTVGLAVQFVARLVKCSTGKTEVRRPGADRDEPRPRHEDRCRIGRNRNACRPWEGGAKARTDRQSAHRDFPSRRGLPDPMSLLFSPRSLSPMPRPCGVVRLQRTGTGLPFLRRSGSRAPHSKLQLPVIRIPSSCSLTFTRGRLLHAAQAIGRRRTRRGSGVRPTHRSSLHKGWHER